MKQGPFFAGIFLVTAALVTAQTTNPEEITNESSPIKIIGIRPSNGSITSGGPVWTKLLVDFEVRRPWIDGMQISVLALIGDGTKERPFSLLAGLLRHLNVPEGKSTTALYISPNTTKRYGKVSAIRADVYLNDRVVSTLDWLGKGFVPPQNWSAVYDRKEGALLPITATPWLTVEYDSYPDPLLGR